MSEIDERRDRQRYARPALGSRSRFEQSQYATNDILVNAKLGGDGAHLPVAHRLAVSKATVYGLCASGKLAHVRIMNILGVRPVDLREFIEASMNSRQ